MIAVRRFGTSPIGFAPASLPISSAHAPAALTTRPARNSPAEVDARHAPPAHSSARTSALFTRVPPRADEQAQVAAVQCVDVDVHRVGFEQPRRHLARGEAPDPRAHCVLRQPREVAHERRRNRRRPAATSRSCDSVATSSVPRGVSSGVGENPAGGRCRNGLLACDSARFTSLP